MFDRKRTIAYLVMCGFSDVQMQEQSDLVLLGLARDQAAIHIDDVVIAMLSNLPPCTWTQNSDSFWETSCGNAFEFTVDGPAENSMRFCCYCGGALVVVLASAEPCDDDMADRVPATIMGMPVMFTEELPALSTGDVLLADLSYYITDDSDEK